MMEHGRGNDFDWQGGMHHAHDGWWSGPLHFLLLLVLLTLLVAAVVWLVRRLAPAAAATTAGAAGAPSAAAATGGAVADPAVATLRMRYARGEVSREDFQRTLVDLTGAGAGGAGSTGGAAEAETADWPGGAPAPEDEATPSA
jgi:uncharacterized membrane protein